MKKENQELYISFIRKYISNPDALLWVIGYASYVHAIDDIIDEEIPKDNAKDEFILKTFEMAHDVYVNVYYLNNLHALKPLAKMASNTYMDSVQMERSNSQWKKSYADVLRTMGNEILLAVIEIEGGIDLRRRASLELREISYKTHHTALGYPV